MNLTEIAKKHDTDKGKIHNYTPIYEKEFSHLRDKNIKLLEIGIFKGSSLKMWKDFFSQGTISGIDINPECKQYEEPRINVFIGNQMDKKFTSELISTIGEPDIILDDGGHSMQQQVISFKLLFPSLKKGGIYVIEDLHTSYWRNVGNQLMLDSPLRTIDFLKFLIDCVNFKGAVTGRANSEDKIPLYSGAERYFVENIDSIQFFSSLCFIRKK